MPALSPRLQLRRALACVNPTEEGWLLVSMREVDVGCTVVGVNGLLSGGLCSPHTAQR